VLLREARYLPVYATPAVQSILDHDSRFLPVARAFSDVPVTTLVLNTPVAVGYRDGAASGLLVEAFSVPAGAPRFATREEEGHTVGLMLREEASGKTCAFVPGCGDLDGALLQRLAEAEALLFDGTFWCNDELIALGIGERTAREMDHLPIAGQDGSLDQLATLPCQFRVYTHINNTNPILLEHSAERAAVARTGVIVGFDGLQLTL
jgi:pyrroloquinoline quinone biosynthesis protein B